VNALDPECIAEVLDEMRRLMKKSQSKFRLLLHSIAYGNLKLLAPMTDDRDRRHRELLKDLSARLDVPEERLQKVFDDIFEQGNELLSGAATPPSYRNEDLLQDEDFTLTVHSMGTSLATWVYETWRRKLFASDARVIGLTSEGNEVAWRGYAAVSAAKTAMEAVARSIAIEYAPYGLRTNVIQAGVTDTAALQLIPGSQHLKATAKSRNPFNRITTTQDVADFIYLMCLDEAAWVNGTVIRVDGGEHISG
jgi:enoyl-[acyl-carrier-protein] reductase (NADH)